MKTGWKWWFGALLALAACGGDGGNTTVNVPPGSTITQGDGSTLTVVPVQPPDTTTCDTTITAQNQPLNIFCDASGNAVAAGPVNQNSNNGNAPTSNSGNTTTTTTNPAPTPAP